MTATDPKSGDSISAVPIDIDDVATALNNNRRRFTIRYVDENPSPVEVGNLAETIAEIERGQPMEELDAQARKRVYIALIQEHLPTLDEMDAVYFDERQKILMPSTKTVSLAKLVRFLEAVSDGGTLPKPQSGNRH
jgi:hypothetical protein